ncbi:hypothetical protein HUJ04_013362 [Dendroctonus ponderosae]
MSFESYTNWWIRSKKRLEDLQTGDETIRRKFKPINDRNLANDLIGGLYAQYSRLVQELTACLDQMAQPQKRVSVKKLVDAACIRLSEFNDELRKISLSEFHCIDGTLVELKMVPYDVEILHPCLFHHRPVNVEDLVQRIQRGETIYKPPTATVVFSQTNLEAAQPPTSKSVVFAPEPNESGPPEEQPQTSEADQPKRRSTKILVSKEAQQQQQQLDFTAEELETRSREEQLNRALVCLQTAERGRQERVYFYEKNAKLQRSKALRQPGAKKEAEKPEDPAVNERAAMQIQKTWRGYKERDHLEGREQRRRLLIGMTEPSWRSTKEAEVFEANLARRRTYRDQKILEYIQAMDREKARILRVVAPGLLEDIEDEIREWFHRWYVEARTFDKYPPEDKGGTILVVRGETMTPKEYLDDYELKRREKAKAGGKEALKAKQAKEKKLKQEAEKKKKEAEKKLKEAAARKKKKKKPGEYELAELAEPTSTALKRAGEEEFQRIWDKRGEQEDPYLDLINEQYCYETQLEIRRQADELMRLELEILQEALAKDKGKKYKKKKQKNKRKKGKKKGKKDLTANRMIEDLFQELVNNGVIRCYPQARLDEFLGDFSYNNTELRAKEFDPAATILDVRQAVTLNCIQPLGVEIMKKPRSVLLVGPRQSGIHLLANAVFNHTQCVLFDLSPEVTAGIYEGSKGLGMLIHLVTKMSKLLQPSIIYFDRAERVFYKKVPKDERELDPKRVGKKLVKGIIKAIKPEDRVLVLGATCAPWLAQAAKLKKAFERVILIPRPDYGSVYLWWRELLRPYHGVDRNFNFTSLATVTVNQPYPVIKQAVELILTARRIVQLKYKPLRAQELHEVFVANQLEPITDKEWKKFQKWYKKTPLGKERAIFNKWADGKREQEKKQQEKQKGKK